MNTTLNHTKKSGIHSIFWFFTIVKFDSTHATWHNNIATHRDTVSQTMLLLQYFYFATQDVTVRICVRKRNGLLQVFDRKHR